MIKKLFTIILSIIFPILLLGQDATSWYKTYSGKIGNMKGVLHLASSTDLNGYLWFNQGLAPIEISGTRKGKDSVELTSVGGVLSISLTGIINKGVFKGTSVISLQYGNSQNPEKKAGFELREDTSYTSFEIQSAKTLASLPSSLKNESTFSAEIQTIWPVKNSVYTTRLQTAIRQFLDIPTNKVPISTQIHNAVLRPQKEWLKENSKLSPKEAADMGLSLSEELLYKVSIMYEDARTISLAQFAYAYTGGAHGNYSTSIKNILKKNGANINLSDILTPEGVKRLPFLLNQAARTTYKVTGALKDNGFLVDKIPVSKEFCLMRDGIAFYYSPYEIKPFSDGEVSLFIPIRSISAYLKPAYK